METRCVLAVWLFAVQVSFVCSQCEVFVSESPSWPGRVIVPLNSTAVEINCKLEENVEPFWAIDLAEDTLPMSALQFNNRRVVLNEYGVFELPTLEPPGQPPTLRLLINDTERNNQTVIACIGVRESRQTTLFVYEPVTFELDATDLDTVQLQANISWSPQNLSTSLDANQTFTLTVTSTNTELRTIRIANERHYVFEAQEDAPPCEVYNFSVTATPVGATYTGDGCSVPSPVLSRMLPSLPDITPLKQSQNYSLQSLQSGEIELTVYFQPATYCEDYPVTNYTLECKGDSMMVQFTSEENFITARNLSENAVYLCTVYALNSVGSVSTDDALRISTTDVQRVLLTKVTDYSSDIKCHFINGSDAGGCKVVIVSEHASVKNISVMLMKAGESDSIASAVLNLTHPFDCYSNVFAYDIEADYSIGSLAVAGVIEGHNTTTTLVTCTITTEGRESQLPVILAVSVLLLILLMIPLISLIVLLIRWRRTRTSTPTKVLLVAYENKYPQKDTTSTTQLPMVTVKDDQEPPHTPNTQATESTESSMHKIDAYNVEHSTSVIQTESIPIYALPDKLKQKNTTELQTTTEETTMESVPREKEEGSYNTLNCNNDHIYYLLESVKNTKTEEATPPIYESPKKLAKSSADPLPVYQ